MDTGIYKVCLKKSLNAVVSVAVSALVTFLLLCLFAFFMLRAELSADIENIGLICISVISCFLGGFLCGKRNGTKGFLWGLAVGIFYFFLIVLIRIFSGQDVSVKIVNLITTFLYCGASGMLGGMLS